MFVIKYHQSHVKSIILFGDKKCSNIPKSIYSLRIIIWYFLYIKNGLHDFLRLNDYGVLMLVLFNIVTECI